MGNQIAEPSLTFSRIVAFAHHPWTGGEQINSEQLVPHCFMLLAVGWGGGPN
jgi:hypothetical protein